MIKVYNEAGRLTRTVNDMYEVIARDENFIEGIADAKVTKGYGTIYVNFADIDPAKVDVGNLITVSIDDEIYVPFPIWGIEWEPISGGEV